MADSSADSRTDTNLKRLRHLSKKNICGQKKLGGVQIFFGGVIFFPFFPFSLEVIFTNRKSNIQYRVQGESNRLPLGTVVKIIIDL